MPKSSIIIFSMHFLAMGVSGIAAFLAVFTQFSQIPLHLSYDEVEFAKLALSLENIPYTPYSTLATGHSTLYFYILLASLKLFGVTSVALRLPSAIFGVVNIILVFYILTIIFKNWKVGIIGSTILLTSHWYVNFARFSFEATFLLFLELTCILFLIRWISTKKTTYLLLSSLFAGLAFHSYYPGRIFFVLPALFILKNSPKKNIILFSLVFFAIVFPLLIALTNQPDIRVSQISFLSNPDMSIFDKSIGVSSNISKTILMPFLHGDMNGRHNFPGKAALNPILALLFILGMILKNTKEHNNIRKYAYVYLLLSVIPTVFTLPADNPNMLRTYTALPSIIYFVCSALISLQILLGKFFKKSVVTLLIVILVTLSSVYELRTYFTYQARVFRNSFEITCPLKDVVYKNPIPLNCRVRKDLF